MTLALPWFAQRLKAGAGGHHRRESGARGIDDFLGIYPLEVDHGGAEAGLAVLPLLADES